MNTLSKGRPVLRRLIGLCLVALVVQFGLWPAVGQAAGDVQSTDFAYFSATGHNVEGLFYQNWLVTGGLASNGLPLTETFKDKDGMTIQVFERSILELHQAATGSEGEPQSQPYIEHKLLGNLLTTNRNFPKPELSVIVGAEHYYGETGHTLGGAFAEYWTHHGGLAAFGYPISQEFQETNPDDGQTYLVQYFERNRFEYHPDQAGTPYEVQLGLLGRSYFASHYNPALLNPAPSLARGPQASVRVPSLMYHHIRELSDNAELNDYSVTPEAFVAQMDWLQANGYHTVTMAQIADYLKYGIPLPDKPVNLRFDDSWQNQLFAAQEMKKRGMTATFFVITQARSYPNMTPTQLKQLDAEGFEVASHTRNHPFLTRNGPDYDWNQIKGSKEDLEKLLGHPVRSFAYPFGDHNPGVDRLVAQAGYDIAVTVNWSVVFRADRMFTEPTISVSNVRTLNSFIARLNYQW